MFAATTGLIDDRWQRFMQFQIARTRQIFAEAEAGVNLLAPDARLPVWCAGCSLDTDASVPFAPSTCPPGGSLQTHNPSMLTLVSRWEHWPL